MYLDIRYWPFPPSLEMTIHYLDLDISHVRSHVLLDFTKVKKE